MSNNEHLTDDYVAGLLVSEANDASLKYSALGVDAYKSTKRPPGTMKPNTRFLENLLKGTESHNTARLAKEAAESQAKLQELSDAEKSRRRRYKPEATDIRRRQLGDIKSILNGRFPKRNGNPETSSSPRHHAQPDANQRQTSSSHHSENNERDAGYRQKRPRSREDYTCQATHDNSCQNRSSWCDSESDRGRPRRHKRARECLPSRSRSPSTWRSIKRDRDRSRRNGHSQRSREQRIREHHDVRGGKGDRPTRSHTNSDLKVSRDESQSRLYSKTVHQGESHFDSNSDSDLIGPTLASRSPIRRRGRCAVAGSSGIDRRFSASYDPKEDMEAGSEDGWDEAKEAFRHRQNWKQKGAERLKEAGFSESQVKKWESGGERRLEDVQWSKRGEKREWDRGKVVGPDGSVSVAVEWGRGVGGEDDEGIN